MNPRPLASHTRAHAHRVRPKAAPDQAYLAHRPLLFRLLGIFIWDFTAAQNVLVQKTHRSSEGVGVWASDSHRTRPCIPPPTVLDRPGRDRARLQSRPAAGPEPTRSIKPKTRRVFRVRQGSVRPGCRLGAGLPPDAAADAAGDDEEEDEGWSFLPPAGPEPRNELNSDPAEADPVRGSEWSVAVRGSGSSLFYPHCSSVPPTPPASEQRHQPQPQHPAPSFKIKPLHFNITHKPSGLNHTVSDTN